MAAHITEVLANSIGQEIGLEAGDILLAIDDYPIDDILDYQFYSQEESLTLRIEKRDGEIWLLEIEKDLDEDLGLLFQDPVFDSMKTCQNRCAFCFIDQLPEKMRETLYVKDDDYRYSFLFGNFVTFTNMKESDWEKLLRLRLSPLYISVHCLRPDLRAELMNNSRAADIGMQLERLQNAGLEVHTQIVLCPGINDGEILDETISGLAAYYPAVRSVGIVPVGLTGHRQLLKPMVPVSTEQAEALIKNIEHYQAEFRKEFALGFVYLADEFFIKTGHELPPAEYYDDFCQIENGIGLARLLMDDFADLEGDLPSELSPREYTIITGQSALPIIEHIGKRLQQISGLSLNLLAVPNRYFAGNVTVTGLLTGHDIIQVLKQEFKGKDVILPAVLLKQGTDLFLDNLSVKQISEKTGARLNIVDGAQELIELLCTNPPVGA